MGIFYLDARMVSKAKQSAVAKASYVSNEKLFSERDEEFKEYKSRSVKPESFIMSPKHAPDWVNDREKLWNEVEKVEKNYNSQLLREIVVALPIELPKEQQTMMLKEYINENFIEEGMVADTHIHRDQEQNPHAHILLTIRPFHEDGTWWKTKSKKEYILDENGDFTYRKDGKKRDRKIDLTGWNSKEKLMLWRKNFAEKVNEFYNYNDIDESISHLSYAEQGKEVLSKHRLTRNEYHTEKREKNKAEKNGYEYVPVTHYGALNKIIEAYNEEIKEIESKIISLEDYKARQSPVELKTFKDIREKAVVKFDDLQAIQFVKKRSKSNYVDYSISRKTMDSLDHWKKSIDRKHRRLDRERNVLETAKKHYETNSSNLYKLGFVTDKFASQFNPKAIELDKEYKKLSEEFTSYKEAYNFTHRSLEFQKRLLREEFIYLYPKYNKIAEIDSLEINQIMDQFVTDFKENNVVHSAIREFEQNELYGSQDEHLFRARVWESVLDYRNHSKVYFSLNKKLDNTENNYKDIINIHKNKISESVDSQNKIYTAAVEYLSTKNELDHLSSSYDETKNVLYSSLIELYGKEQEEVIQKLPDRVKVLLLEKYLKERTADELANDLNEVNWKIKEKKMDEDWKNKDDEFSPFEQNNSIGSGVGGLLSDLIEQAKQNEGKYDDLESKRKRAKRKHKKLTKEEQNEIGS